MGERDGEVRGLLGGERGQPPLVDGIQVGVEQADRERRDAAGGQRPDGPAGVGLVERRAHAAVGEHPLGHLADEAARDQRGRLLDLQVVDLVALLAADDQHVAEAAGREQADAGRLALDDDVGAERGAVHSLAQRRPVHAGAADQLVETGQAGRGGIGIRREPLAGRQLARRRLQHEVGERATDVEPDAIRHGLRSGARRGRDRPGTGSAGPSGR